MLLKDRIKKAVWSFLKQPLPFLFFAFDKFYDKAFLPFMSYVWHLEGVLRGAVVGRGLFLGRPILKFYPGSKVVLEKGFTLISSQRRCSSGNLYAPCRIQTHSSTSSIYIGWGAGLNGTSIVSASRSIHIGQHVMIGPNCVIIDSPGHRLWPPEHRLALNGTDLDKDVFIGDNCWIGLGCVILPGSRIGENSVIGARSVVTGEIPQNSLAIGSPAKVVRKLDEE
jgi:acetyltransferase-like isoleucine patch superfamily enzyme